jgi:hypothetical protein
MTHHDRSRKRFDPRKHDQRAMLLMLRRSGSSLAWRRAGRSTGRLRKQPHDVATVFAGIDRSVGLCA